MIKTFYEAPLVKVLEVRTGNIFLASVEKFNVVQGGTWADEDDD